MRVSSYLALSRGRHGRDNYIHTEAAGPVRDRDNANILSAVILPVSSAISTHPLQQTKIADNWRSACTRCKGIFFFLLLALLVSMKRLGSPTADWRIWTCGDRLPRVAPSCTTPFLAISCLETPHDGGSIDWASVSILRFSTGPRAGSVIYFFIISGFFIHLFHGSLTCKEFPCCPGRG